MTEDDKVLKRLGITRERVLQITNDIHEGFTGHTKAELRKCVSYWALRHDRVCAETYCAKLDKIIERLKA